MHSSGAGALVGAMFALVLAVIELGLAVVVLAGMWKVFTKAGKPGWAAIIPIYNIIVMLEIVGQPLWWIVLLIIPVVGIFVALYLVYLLAQAFGKDIGFTIGMIFLPFIFYPILGFGDAQYQGAPATSAGMSM